MARIIYSCFVVAGLPWSFGVDAFALGCVIAEIYLSSNLMSAKVESDREQLATINVLFGPFPVDYARGLEALSPGMFTFNDTAIAVRYPPGNEPISDPDSIADPDHAEALRRLELVQPISVSYKPLKLAWSNLILYRAKCTTRPYAI